MERFRFYSFWLVGLCVAFFLVQLLSVRFTDAFVLNEHAFVEPWRFITSVFLHGGLGHLVYNMFALALFGSMLERLVGGKRLLLIFFVTGVGANLISIFFYPSSLGASGAIFGIIGALVIIRPTLVVWAFGLPMPLFIAGILWVAGDVIGAASYLTGSPIDNTGNIAHLSGIGLGFVFGLFYRNWSARSQSRERVSIHEGSMREWEDRWMNSR